MKFILALLCVGVLLPGVAFAQTAESEAGTLQVEQLQYIVKRTGDVLVKVFGIIDLNTNYANVVLTHTTPEAESITHNVRTNSDGYYEFYFVHDWESTRGTYEVFVSRNSTAIGAISYELVQDSSYKTDKQVKEEYLSEGNTGPNIAKTPDDELLLPKKIPDWVKNVFGWYYMDRISEQEVISAIEYLVRNEIIKLD